MTAPSPAPAQPTELVPCPFCGGKATRQNIDYNTCGAEPDDPNYNGSFIECDDCGACSHVEFGYKENLIELWNMRVGTCQPDIDKDTDTEVNPRPSCGNAKREAYMLVTARINDLENALRLFLRQWNTCGPNSDFGRYFSNIRQVAEAALKSHEPPGGFDGPTGAD